VNESRFLMTPEAALRLTERLARVKSVSQFDQPGEPQASTLAHSLTDLEKSFREILETQLPRLTDESLSPDQLNDVLLDIGEELRHVLYHIKDPKFFDYLIERDAGGS
jgi:SUMO ligase MMS21 Smc5/6 complex component